MSVKSNTQKEVLLALPDFKLLFSCGRRATSGEVEEGRGKFCALVKTISRLPSPVQ